MTLHDTTVTRRICKVLYSLALVVATDRRTSMPTRRICLWREKSLLFEGAGVAAGGAFDEIFAASR
jgi:hypothetical protein